jgi:hypothetical protein
MTRPDENCPAGSDPEDRVGVVTQADRYLSLKDLAAYSTDSHEGEILEIVHVMSGEVLEIDRVYDALAVLLVNNYRARMASSPP